MNNGALRFVASRRAVCYIFCFLPSQKDVASIPNADVKRRMSNVERQTSNLKLQTSNFKPHPSPQGERYGAAA